MMLSAENEIKYMIANNNEVSFHYAVDDKEVFKDYQLIVMLGHAVMVQAELGNSKGIHIEICYSKSGGS